MGMVVDRFSTRWGRYRHWIVGAAPVLMLATWFLYLPGPGEHGAGYLLGWLIVLYAAYTVIAIAHQSWGAELAHSYHERSRLYGWRELVGIGGMTIVLALPALMESTGSGDAYSKIGSMGWYLLILLPVTTWLIVTRVPDDVPAAWGTTMDMRAVFRAISTNAALRRCLVADFSCALATGVTGSTYIFLAVWVFEVPSHASLILLVYFMAGLAIVPLWMRATKGENPMTGDMRRVALMARIHPRGGSGKPHRPLHRHTGLWLRLRRRADDPAGADRRCRGHG